MKLEIMLSALHSDEISVSKTLNPTVLSDELLEMCTPIIFIQHPAIVIPSWLRLASTEYGSLAFDDEDFAIWTSLRWSRILFDYLRSTIHLKKQNKERVDSAHSAQSVMFNPSIVATQPYVIDAADVLNNPHVTLATLWRLLGVTLDSKSSWSGYFSKAADTLKKVVPNSLMKAFNNSVLGVEGADVDTDREIVQWRVEFGDEMAEMLKQKVNEDMPHYEYLMNFKISISQSRTMTGFMRNITGLPGRRQSLTPETTQTVNGMPPLKLIQSAVDGNPKERHFSV